jgi:hypothetical protein
VSFVLLMVCSLLRADDSFAQTGEVSQGVVKGEVGAKADELLARYSMYGFSGTVLIVKNNRIVFHKAYGLADIEAAKPNTLDTLYDVGSIAKTFTAAAILQLEMRGKLKTSDAISQYLGEFPADKAGITIHHLLSHTAGLKLYAGDVGINPITPPDEFLRKVKAGKEIITALSKSDFPKLTSAGLLVEKDAPVLQARWKAWMNAVGALQSFQLIGVSPGAGGNPRAFIKLNGDKTSLVVRLLFNWNQTGRRLPPRACDGHTRKR